MSNYKKHSPDDTSMKKDKWINQQKVLVLATRGISHQHRHLMKDIENLMPHSTHGNKVEKRDGLFEVNEICALKGCNKCILLESCLGTDLYLWISNIPHGPSAKFLVENIYTSGELNLSGNCLKESRTLLSFDNSFMEHPHYRVLQELFSQTFGVPYHHPQSQSFTERTLVFSILDNRIWCRNYQIVNEDGTVDEIGPRFVLQPIRIFAGGFCGPTLWENPHFVPPLRTRHLLMEIKKELMHRKDQKIRKRKKENQALLNFVSAPINH